MTAAEGAGRVVVEGGSSWRQSRPAIDRGSSIRKRLAHSVPLFFGAGRLGSAIGPIMGGDLISTHFSMKYLFCLAAIPLVIGLVNAIILTRPGRGKWRREGTLTARPVGGDE